MAPSMDGDDEDQDVRDPTPELDQEDMVESDPELDDAAQGKMPC